MNSIEDVIPSIPPEGADEERSLNNASMKTSGNEIVMDAACKAAEAKVIEVLKSCDEDFWICPSVDTCIATPRECSHTEPHSHDGDGCDITCVAAKNKCVKVNSCKECATLREEIINRDAVILQHESRAEDREEIIKALAKEIKVMRQGENVAIGSGGGQSGCGDEPALTIGKFKIAFSGKRECMVKQGVHTRLLRDGDIVTVNPVMTIRGV
ncbi:MAG: hypothetical protein KAJ03_09820 [Gammaproteobacteria bacterium]|nr:hypothetical protein [Gammaproteobacteria bacterium]